MIKQRPYVKQRTRETKRAMIKIPRRDRYYVIDFLDIRKPQAWKFDFFTPEQALDRISKVYPGDENYFQIWKGIKLSKHLDTIIYYRTPTVKIYDYPEDCLTIEQRYSFRSTIQQRNKRARIRKEKSKISRKKNRTRRRQAKHRDLSELDQ